MKKLYKDQELFEIAGRKPRIFAQPRPTLISALMESNTKWG